MLNPKHVDISIVIPAYNEAQRIGPTLTEYYEFLCSEPATFEIVVVDDGSSDGTAAEVERIAQRMPPLRCVSYPQNRGKGNAVRVGMTSARGALRIMCDADGSMPASELPKLLRAMEGGNADIAIGSRYLEGASSGGKQPLWRRMWSRTANYIVRKSLVGGIADTQCGFKAFSAAAAEAVFTQTRIDGWAFDLEALALAKKMGIVVEEVAVHWTDDERSRVSPLKDAINIAREWLTIRRNLRRGIYNLAPLASRSLPAVV